jgi:hypothetical protein
MSFQFPHFHAYPSAMAVLVIHLIATLARLLGPGGVRSLVAGSLLLKHQLLIVNRSRQRSPNLSGGDRILAGLLALWCIQLPCPDTIRTYMAKHLGGTDKSQT